MKRDMDLIRKILLQVEDSIHLPLLIEGYSSEEVRYHNFLLVDAGLARGVSITDLSDSMPQYELTSLTWKGHEFLDAARNENNWKRAKDILSTVGGISFAVLKELLILFIKQDVGLEG